MKTDRLNSWATTVAMPRPTRIDSERHEHRHQPGDDRSEDQHQDDDGDGQAEVQLSVFQVARGQGVEVVADGVLAGDGHGEPAATVGGLNRGDHRFDVRVGRGAQVDQRRVPVGGHQRAGRGSGRS